MGQIADIILPVFGLLGLGYAAAWSGYLDNSVGRGIETYVHRVAIPLLVFRLIVATDPPATAPFGLLLSYFGAVAVVWLAATWLAPRLTGIRDGRVAIVATGSSYSNSALLGLPLIVQTFGDEGAIIFFILFPFHLPILTIANAIHIELVRGRGVRLGKLVRNTLWSIATNAMVVAIVAGVLWRATGLGIPGVAEAVTRAIADTALATALFAMGLSLRGYGFVAGFRGAALMSVLKLVCLPALVWFFAGHLAGIDSVAVGVMTVFAAAPVGVTAYILAARADIGIAEASSAITLSTALSLVTVTVVLFLLGLQ